MSVSARMLMSSVRSAIVDRLPRQGCRRGSMLASRGEHLRLRAPPQHLGREIVLGPDLLRDATELLRLLEPSLSADRVREQRGRGGLVAEVPSRLISS